jgi:hypothetical protein
MDLRGTECEGVDWFEIGQERNFANTTIFEFHKNGITWLSE